MAWLKQYRLRWLLILLLIIATSILVWQSGSSTLLAPRSGDDFIEYWAAARLQMKGGNPYDPSELLVEQQSAGWPNNEALIMYNPPWTLPLLLPFGLVDYLYGRILWLFVSYLIILFAADWFWRFYGGPVRLRWVSWLVGFGFVPALAAIRGGQINPFILLGLLGFIASVHHRRWWLAGAFCFFISLKPQLLHLFWLALLLWAIEHRRWQIVMGAAGAVCLALGIALLMNPQALTQFIAVTIHHSPDIWITPTIGAALRFLFGPDHFWLQFLAPFLSAIWFFYYWRTHRQEWDWAERLPLILLVSLLTTSYAWMTDQVVLIPVVALVSVWLWSGFHRRRIAVVTVLLCYLLLTAGALSLNLMRAGDFWYIWLPAAWLSLYLWAQYKLGLLAPRYP